MQPTITPQRVAQLLTEAPGWARVGLTAPTARLRDAAADELGKWVCERLEGCEEDAGQLALPLATQIT